MITVQKEAITALAGLKWTRKNIGEAVTLNNNDSHGVILPVGDGSIAIVGARDEKLEEVRKQILQSVAWST